jgi:arabinose-5-phosphate isomerase
MRTGTGLALVTPSTKVKDVLLAITKARSGCACVVDMKGHLLGFFTDGDLRRHLDQDLKVLFKSVDTVMTTKPTAILKDKLAADAFDMLKTKKIDEIPFDFVRVPLVEKFPRDTGSKAQSLDSE